MYRILNNLFSPESDGGGAATIDDMVDLFGSDDDPDEAKDKVVTDTEGDLLGDDKTKDKDKEKKDDKKDDKEDKDHEELELEEEKEPEDTELDDADVNDIPRKEILKVYPDIFKKFPQLERAYYRERKYSEILPTIEDAKNAVERAQTYDQFEQTLLAGNLDSVISSIKESAPESYNKVVDNYLPNLMKVDKDAYLHTVGNMAKNVIMAMVQEADTTKNENLKSAAVLLNQFMFGSSTFKAPSNFGGKTDVTPEITAKEKELQQREANFIGARFNNTLEELNTSSQNIVKSTISKHIDPKDVMTDYVKRTAIKEAVADVEQLMIQDTRFKTIIDKLWERAFNNDFSEASKADLRRAYLNKAKTLLPSVIQKHRNAALKGLGKRVTEDKEEPTKKGHVSVGRSATADNSGKDKNKVPQGMKTLDYLMQD